MVPGAQRSILSDPDASRYGADFFPDYESPKAHWPYDQAAIRERRCKRKHRKPRRIRSLISATDDDCLAKGAGGRRGSVPYERQGYRAVHDRGHCRLNFRMVRSGTFPGLHRHVHHYSATVSAWYSHAMPRWFFLLVSVFLGLALAGSALIILRSPTPVEQRQN
jgi:hypothetical protein